MIRVRVRVVNEDGSFTVVILAPSLREVEQAAKDRYPESVVKIDFPIEPDGFFANGPHGGVRTGLEATERLTNPIRLS